MGRRRTRETDLSEFATRCVGHVTVKLLSTMSSCHKWNIYWHAGFVLFLLLLFLFFCNKLAHPLGMLTAITINNGKNNKNTRERKRASLCCWLLTRSLSHNHMLYCSYSRSHSHVYAISLLTAKIFSAGKCFFFFFCTDTHAHTHTRMHM